MFVIGTAGHVDHGKSTLVQALTGIDPDRLREEKERGMTIDLGFAWMRLPSGNEVSIVDVPGHERFVNNMLAGVGGIDLALLVVAADESVMPQTREHLAIVDLLNIDRGLAVVTKKDLVDDDWLELVVADVEDVLEGTSLEGSQVLTVSGETGDGLPELTAAIDSVLARTEARRDLGRPRLNVDRAFTIAGFGTVVTGTLIDGVLDVGQQATLVPSDTDTRIRSLQTHRQSVERALPGSRVAANLGGVSHEEIFRGDVLTTPGWLTPSIAVDVRLRVIEDAPRPVRHNMFVTVHAGASETVARVRLLDAQEAQPGESVWAQLKMEEPVAVVKDDYFVLRSNQATLGGGAILETHARRHRRMHAPVLDRLAVMEEGSDRELLVKGIETSEPIEFRALVNLANFETAAAKSELERMAEEGEVVILGDSGVHPGALIFTAGGSESVARRARDFLRTYHREHPLRQGASKEELRSRLRMTPQVFAQALPRLRCDADVVEQGAVVRLTDHAPRLSGEHREDAEAYVRQLEADRFSPPTDSAPDADVLALLADEGRIVRVSETVAFSADAYEEMERKVTDHLRDRGRITVADVRDLFDTSRKYALALLEHLDKRRITRRVEDARVLR